MCCITWQQYFWLNIVIWSWVEFWRCAYCPNILCYVNLIRTYFSFFVVQNSFASSSSEQSIYLHSCLHSKPLGLKKLLILNVNGVFCYFSQFVVLQGNAWVFGRNIDKSKVKVRAKMKHFFACTFEKFYITIWSRMKLEDVLEVFPMLILNMFMDQFVFIWKCE